MAVHTTDNYLVLLRRSERVAEGQGLLDVPGGHPEPQNVGITTMDLGGEGGPTTTTPQAVVREIFQSAVDEVRDEVNLPESMLGEVRLMGVVRQSNSGGCPSAALVVQCQCSGEEVMGWYRQGAKEAFESSSLVLLPVDDLLTHGLQQYGDMTPGAQGCLKLFELLCLKGRSGSVVTSSVKSG